MGHAHESSGTTTSLTCAAWEGERELCDAGSCNGEERTSPGSQYAASCHGARHSRIRCNVRAVRTKRTATNLKNDDIATDTFEGLLGGHIRGRARGGGER